MMTTADIMKLETAFWQAMVDQKPEKAASMLTDKAASVAMFGIHHFSPSEYIKMAEEGSAKITAFSFSDENVIFPVPDVAIATYKVRQSFEMNGKPQEMNCFDTTTWVKSGSNWLAAAHTETPEQQGPPA